MRSLLPLVLCPAVCSTVWADEPGFQTAKIAPSEIAIFDSFGRSVGIDGELVVIGSPADDDNGTNSGSVYLYDANTGQQLFKLLPADGEAQDAWGSAVAVEGSVVCVGAIADDDQGTLAGSVYVYDAATGQKTLELYASDAASEDFFGSSLALASGIALVGAPGDDDNGASSGSAYVFDVATGQQLFKLLANDGGPNDLFGRSVALAGNLALIGSFDDVFGPNSGAAYVFDVTTGQQLLKLLPNDGAAFDWFASSVALSGTTAYVSALLDDDNGFNSGSVYRFDALTGQQLDKLIPSGGALAQSFGTSLAADESSLLVGTSDDYENGFGAGAAYLFDANTGLELAKLLPQDGVSDAEFGSSVSISGSLAAIGAQYDPEVAHGGGAVYLYDVRRPIGARYCNPAVVNSTGSSGSLCALGSDIVSNQDVLLAAADLAPNQFAMFLLSQTQGSTVAPGSQGVLCLDGAIGRFTQDVQFTGPAGAAFLEVDLAQVPSPTGWVSIVAGQTWNFQLWYRDVNPGPTSNFTDAVSIQFQ